jgi:hypothetical protein
MYHMLPGIIFIGIGATAVNRDVNIIIQSKVISKGIPMLKCNLDEVINYIKCFFHVYRSQLEVLQYARIHRISARISDRDGEDTRVDIRDAMKYCIGNVASAM